MSASTPAAPGPVFVLVGADGAPVSVHPDQAGAAARVGAGGGTQVVEVPWVTDLEPGPAWHAMTVYLDPAGLEVSRQERSGAGGRGGHGVTWRHVSGEAGQGGVRLDVWGPDRAWCIAAARRAWAALSAS